MQQLKTNMNNFNRKRHGTQILWNKIYFFNYSFVVIIVVVVVVSVRFAEAEFFVVAINERVIWPASWNRLVHCSGPSKSGSASKSIP